MAVAEFLASGGYDHHLRHIRREYARNVNLLAQAVTRYFPPETRVTHPTGGIVVWVQLPDTVDSLELYKLALQNNITIAPGYLFSATDQYSKYIRLNAAAWSYPVERAVERLGELVGAMV
jgi:DNA-binding transcriptional MocR family regulator